MPVMVELKEHPILITLQDAISGNGFLAGVTLSGGRALMRQEDGRWWMYGVRPAGIAEAGGTIEEAFLRFRNRYKEVLFDIALESNSFEQFKAAVEEFFYEGDKDDEDERLWEHALKAIRSGRCEAPEPFAKLPREVPEQKPSQIRVQRLDQEGTRFVASNNVPDMYSLPTAA